MFPRPFKKKLKLNKFQKLFKEKLPPNNQLRPKLHKLPLNKLPKLRKSD